MSGFLRSDNIELAGLDHVPAPGHLLPVPSTDAERSAFVKEIARAALDLGVQDAHASVRSHTHIGPPPTKLMFPNGLKGAPASIGEPQTPSAEAGQRNAKIELNLRWYQVTVWLCGAPEIVRCRAPLSPAQLDAHIWARGLQVELTDGGLDTFDPASISRVRIEVHYTKPPQVLHEVRFKTKRGA